MKPVRLIFEGADGAGKSTLLSKVAKELDYVTRVAWTAIPYQEFDHDVSSVNKHLMDMYELGLKMTRTLKTNILFDRFHLTEIVYREFKKDKLIGDRDSIEDIFKAYDNCLRNLNFKVIYVTADTNTLHNRIVERGDWYIDPKDISAISEGYKTIMRQTTLPVYNFSSGLPMNQNKVEFDKLMKWIRGEEKDGIDKIVY